MGDYIKPWRRKIGVLTLVIASYIAFHWVASFGHEHTVPSLLPAFEWPEFNNGRVEYWPTMLRWKTASTSLTNGDVVFTQDRLAWSIPCWSIVIPLTLVSAYLLFSKSGKSARKKLCDLIPNEGM